jgi:hypothetical protein
MSFEQMMQIATIVIPVVGGLGGIISAIATYRNISSQSKNEARRIDIEAARLDKQDDQAEVSMMERIQQMSMQIAERQSQQNQLLRNEIQQLRSEMNALEQSHEILRTKFHVFVVELEDLVIEFRKKPVEEQVCDVLIYELCSKLDVIRKQNGFH